MLKSLVLKTPCAKCSYLVEEILVDLLVAFYQSVDQRVSGHQAFVRYGVVLAAERLEALGAVLEHLQDENTIISHIIQGNSTTEGCCGQDRKSWKYQNERRKWKKRGF